jgi:hypothetical protein
MSDLACTSVYLRRDAGRHAPPLLFLSDTHLGHDLPARPRTAFREEDGFADEIDRSNRIAEPEGMFGADDHDDRLAAEGLDVEGSGREARQRATERA